MGTYVEVENVLQTLGISSNTPRSDGRFKSLFWPTIAHDGDLEYITEQGFWICAIIAVGGYAIGVLQGRPVASLFDFAFFFLAGVGVRQRSLPASIAVFAVYLANRLVLWRMFLVSGSSAVPLVFLALLLANIRGIWLSNEWSKKNELPRVARLNDTFLDKLSGRLPEFLWPKAKGLFAVLALLELIWAGMLLANPPTIRQIFKNIS